MEELKSKLTRMPLMMLGLLYCAYLGFDYYTWLSGDDSELGLKKANIVAAEQQLQVTRGKLKSSEEFLKNLDEIRDRIRKLAADLDSIKTTLSAQVDVANFVRIMHLETKKLNMGFNGIKPEPEISREHYVEAPFSVTVRGAYIQFAVLFDRLSRLQDIVNVASFELRPTDNAFTKYVELEGTIRLMGYRYVGNEADSIVSSPEMKANVAPTRKLVEKGGAS